MKIQAINLNLANHSKVQKNAQMNVATANTVQNDTFELQKSNNVSFGNTVTKAVNDLEKFCQKGFRKIKGLMCDETGGAYTGIIKKASGLSEYNHGKLIREELDSIDRKVVYSYDKNGNLSSLEQFDNRGVLLSRNDYMRDDDGRLIRSVFYED